MRVVAHYRALLANGPLTRLLAGEFISAIGDWLYIVALLVVIYTETSDPLLLGVFGAVRSLPYIVLSVPAGVIADQCLDHGIWLDGGELGLLLNWARAGGGA